MKAAVLGGGVIGTGWAARFLLNGWDVALYDPDPRAAEQLDAVLKRARAALPGLLDIDLPFEGQVSVASSVSEAVQAADWIQESVPERLELKHRVFAEIADTDAIVASSTSGFKPRDLDPSGRVIVAHPFNPVYLLPLVELVGDAAQCERAAHHLRALGMYPLTVRKEIDAHIADRLLEAVWREALWLVKDGVATTKDVDDAIRMGFGLRWAQMGLFETYRCAGGSEGMRHFLEQFGPCLQAPWTRLTDVPDYDDALVDLIAGQSDAQSGHLTIDALLDKRDRNLVSLLRALKLQGSAAGRVLQGHEAALLRDDPLGVPVLDRDLSRPVLTARRVVPVDWLDYNGHMTEAKYLQAFGDATDAFMRLIGCDAEYVATGGSYFTAETHIRHLGEVHAGQQITVQTQVLLGTARKMHLFHDMRVDGESVATGEHFLLHVSLETRRPALAADYITESLEKIASAHADLPQPKGAGRAVGARP
jgi:carnitine 3-dehydrogenase